MMLINVKNNLQFDSVDLDELDVNESDKCFDIFY